MELRPQSLPCLPHSRGQDEPFCLQGRAQFASATCLLHALTSAQPRKVGVGNGGAEAEVQKQRGCFGMNSLDMWRHLKGSDHSQRLPRVSPFSLCDPQTQASVTSIPPLSSSPAPEARVGVGKSSLDCTPTVILGFWENVSEGGGQRQRPF